ncbi:hypothetical protein HN51_053383 [Arachis hypogaea]
MRTFKCRDLAVVFLVTLFTCNHSSTSQDIDICQVIFCGVGTCHQTREFPGYRCDCKRGWSKITLPTISSACIVPNCTFDRQCHILPVPLPFPPAPSPTQLHDRSESCLFCGDGECEAKGLYNTLCHCNHGAANLHNNPLFPCFPKCAMKGNCSDGVDLGFGDPPPSPPPQQSASPPPPTSGGSGEMLNNSRELLQKLVATMVLTTIFLI